MTWNKPELSMIFISSRIIIRNNKLSTNKICMIYDLFLSELRQFFALKRLSVFWGEAERGREGTSGFVCLFNYSESTSYSILHYLWSVDLSKSFSQLIISIFVFSQYFFSIAFARLESIMYLVSWFIKFKIYFQEYKKIWFWYFLPSNCFKKVNASFPDLN